jgi:hypothetical protein
LETAVWGVIVPNCSPRLLHSNLTRQQNLPNRRQPRLLVGAAAAAGLGEVEAKDAVGGKAAEAKGEKGVGTSPSRRLRSNKTASSCSRSANAWLPNRRL